MTYQRPVMEIKKVYFNCLIELTTHHNSPLTDEVNYLLPKRSYCIFWESLYIRQPLTMSKCTSYSMIFSQLALHWFYWVILDLFQASCAVTCSSYSFRKLSSAAMYTVAMVQKHFLFDSMPSVTTTPPITDIAFLSHRTVTCIENVTCRFGNFQNSVANI